MEQHEEDESIVTSEQAGLLGKNLLHHFERILHDDPLIDEVGFLHPTQFCSLDVTQNGNSAFQAPEFHQRYFWCRDHKLAISSEILPKLYRAAHDAYTSARTAHDAPLSTTNLMRHSKALLILCPDLLTAWNSRKMVLSLNYDFTMLKDELQLCVLILSYSPKNESTWSHRRWVLKKVAEQHQDMSELIEKESVLVKEIAEKSKMNYRAWRHRCWLIPHMKRKQVLDELKKSTRWSELHVADNCCFHYRRSLLLALRDSHPENGEDSLSWESETHLQWKEELRWDEMLIRLYQGRESLWTHRRFLSRWWIEQLITVEETCPPSTSLVDVFVAQEIHLLSECLNAPADEFEDSCAQAELAALYILWISKQAPAVKGKLEERLSSISMGRLEDVLERTCRPEKRRLWTNLLGLVVAVADQSQ
ncbi:uncharacterized protein LOC133905256 [Phragmites australis]|uniref:uncharacterized protein LOC133905256 n=1 Tax=Phragmites australis TaxID=29695 RepID=UPI002D767D15|nr:uncharacterized protein LOC133905256 [Phragmites australis]XP_062202973.1 uncharacterized protein LOC133905256 [Phragmites australis]XP_062202974.1 uncharacterized protein LOC133905256 [Phragmites australis]XP_062202975.1 uncharacterized protein LOC133905256 [Phragmites australis]XP_062202977.1 uncharacterized protein LOC133905256 [Phragmites australis]XP_062202978.1 uncharacterized protein LOC133905256 [Phragmites australis]XP_062202979.1 uncharacterized protein LOC133905256 [Phragmites a